MLILLRNANLILRDRIRYGYVVIENSRILHVGFGDGWPSMPYERIIDLDRTYLAPGFVELHSHGAGGADFMDGTPDAFETACRTHLLHGTTTLLPTTLAATKEEIFRCIDNFRTAKAALAGKSLNLHGLHMEGPYLSKMQSGAIDPAYIRERLLVL